MFLKFLFISLFLNIYSCCLNKSKLIFADIQGIKVTQVFPKINNDGALQGYDTSSVYIYYYKNMILYKMPYEHNLIVNNKLEKSEIRHHYFIYTKGDSLGFNYDDYKSASIQQVPVDSIFKNEWIKQTKLYPIIYNNNATMIYKKTNKDSGTLYEIYSIKGKTDPGLSGSLFLMFTNELKNINYSLSKELDSISKMKLCSVKIVSDKRYFKGYSVTMDSYESSYKIEKILVANYPEDLIYFDRYKKDSNNPN